MPVYMPVYDVPGGVFLRWKQDGGPGRYSRYSYKYYSSGGALISKGANLDVSGINAMERVYRMAGCRIMDINLHLPAQKADG
jgi:hypothetical protein